VTSRRSSSLAALLSVAPALLAAVGCGDPAPRPPPSEPVPDEAPAPRAGALARWKRVKDASNPGPVATVSAVRPCRLRLLYVVDGREEPHAARDLVPGDAVRVWVRVQRLASLPTGAAPSPEDRAAGRTVGVAHLFRFGFDDTGTLAQQDLVWAKGGEKAPRSVEREEMPPIGWFDLDAGSVLLGTAAVADAPVDGALEIDAAVPPKIRAKTAPGPGEVRHVVAVLLKVEPL
jgi:hypothetical protein